MLIATAAVFWALCLLIILLWGDRRMPFGLTLANGFIFIAAIALTALACQGYEFRFAVPADSMVTK